MQAVVYTFVQPLTCDSDAAAVHLVNTQFMNAQNISNIRSENAVHFCACIQL